MILHTESTGETQSSQQNTGSDSACVALPGVSAGIGQRAVFAPVIKFLPDLII